MHFDPADSIVVVAALAWAGATASAVHRAVLQARADREREAELLASLCVQVSYSGDTDVLTVQRRGVEADYCRGAQHDPNLVLLMSDEHGVVGVQLCEAEVLGAEAWLAHPHREPLPEDLRRALDKWTSSHVALREEDAADFKQSTEG